MDNYLSRLARHLGRHQEYPRRAQRLGQEGVPLVEFSFSRNGELLARRLVRDSEHKLLNEAALAMLERAAPLPEVPEEMIGERFTLRVPVRFRLQ